MERDAADICARLFQLRHFEPRKSLTCSVAMFQTWIMMHDELSVHGGKAPVDPTLVESVEWLPFFRFFHAFEALHLSGGVAAYIAFALEDIGQEIVTDVFPALHLIQLDVEENEECDEPVGSIERFLSLRQLSGLPVPVVNTEDEFFEDDQESL